MRNDVGGWGILIDGGIAIVVISKDITVDGVRGDINDLDEDKFEESDATVSGFIRFPKLRTKSQYTQEVAPLAGAYN